MVVPHYAGAIHEAISRGQVEEMRQVAIQAEEELKQTSAALEKLKQELEKAENQLD